MHKVFNKTQIKYMLEKQKTSKKKQQKGKTKGEKKTKTTTKKKNKARLNWQSFISGGVIEHFTVVYFSQGGGVSGGHVCD